MKVDQTETFQNCQGFTLRKLKLKASEECVTERITINEGMARSRTTSATQMEDRAKERVLVIRTPLRLEFYERSDAQLARRLEGALWHGVRHILKHRANGAEH